MRLSECASQLVIPEGIETTGWPAVAERLEVMGYPFDEWQAGVGAVALGKRKDGLYAAGGSAVVLSIPRQVGKTYMVAGLVFALASLYRNMLVIWTAHHSRTHAETYMSLAQLAKKPGVSRFVSHVSRTNGKEGIEFTNGSRILFGARESGFGRGFAEIDLLVLDEAQILTEKAIEDMVPATNAAPNGLVLMMGTPPRPTDPGEAFTLYRDRALAGESKDTFYVEFSAPRRADIDSPDTWRKANPSYPHRTSENAMRRLRNLLVGDDAFRREALGVWDEKAVGKKAFDPKRWDVLEGEPPAEGVRCFGVKFTPDGSHVAIAGAVHHGDNTFTEAIRMAPMSDGTQWLIDFILDRKDRVAQIVVDGRAGAAYLVNALIEGGVPKRAVITPDAGQAIMAHQMFDQVVTSGTLRHGGQPELTDQVVDAIRRPIGKSGGFGWAAGTEGNTVALLDAATFAVWGAKTTKRRPGRKQRFF